MGKFPHQSEWCAVDLVEARPTNCSPGRYPRVQIFIVAELLEGKKIQFPEHRVETFAKAERKTRHEQKEMF
jgi:hypothetical protein